MTLLVGGFAVIALAVGVPHLLRLERAPAGFAAAIWLSALLLRALASLGAAVAVELYVPMTGVLEPLATLCVGATISGHTVIDALMAVPALVLAGSLAVVIAGLWRAAHRVRHLLRAATIGPGPAGSVVVADGDVLVAVAGLRRPRLVVSAGALVVLDDEELQASLDHERGHIALRHRYVLVAGELARAVGRFLPGTQAAARELVFALERDADRYAIARRNHPAVLASAICKAAGAKAPAPPALALGGGVVARRTQLLLESTTAAAPRAHVGLAALAPVMAVLVVASAIALPFAAHAGYHERHLNIAGQACAPSDAL
jgi:Zn-dependent protease with chaperone function